MEKLQQEVREQQQFMQEQVEDAENERQDVASKEGELEEQVCICCQLPILLNSLPGQFA